MEIFCNVAVGANLDLQNRNDVTYRNDFKICNEITIERLYHPWLQVDFIFNLTKKAKIMYDAVDRLHNFCYWLISERRRILQENLSNEQNNEERELKMQHFYLDDVLQFANNENLSDKDIILEISEFGSAAIDTSTITISTTLLMLAMHSEWQEKVQKELDEIFEDSNRNVTISDTDKMEILDIVIKEGLRISGVPHSCRQLERDTQIGKYVAPAGSIFYVPYYIMSRNSEYWTHPYKFYPEHFLPENVARRPKNCFIPFSYGPRSCPGEKYAMLLTKVILAHILRNFKLSAELKFEDIKFQAVVLLEVLEGYNIRLQSRNKI